ncbi:hypothetical protein [Chlamydia sp.]|uniref:hypothetical protein n=1 Tax=Chlamydia sp. TaxID=35827 RepID=UPI0025C30036|nr:hypothetical protein [Chlamydia sp.]MBQ8498310.1 hypothetical protein [Chlamydia sp.]
MVILKVDLGDSVVMMGYKLTSQLAMLSILLTFTHNVGHANQMSQTLPSAVEARASSEKVEQPRKAKKKAEVDASKNKKSVASGRKTLFSCIKTGMFLANYEQRLVAKKENKLRGKQSKKVSQSIKRRSKAPSEERFFDWLCNSRKADKQKLFEKKIRDAAAVKTEEPCPKAAAVAAARASLSPEEKLQLIREWLAEEKTARKSSRAALKMSSKIKRDGRVTSTLRYDAEKALATRVRRNENSINARVRQKAALQRAKKAGEEKPTTKKHVEANQKTKADSALLPSEQANEEKSAVAPENYFAATASTNSTNVATYLNARQYRCDSSETDWPCSSCVTKRRANFGISVCTMVVTVIAMIVGAVIISNATDSTVASGSGTSGGGSGGTGAQP